MTYEFRWYCEQVSAAVVIQIKAANEADAGYLAAQVLHQLANPRTRSWSFRPSVVVVQR
jgi:hypothetical protein